jgi:hypothetical protein
MVKERYNNNFDIISYIKNHSKLENKNEVLYSEYEDENINSNLSKKELKKLEEE